MGVSGAQSLAYLRDLFAPYGTSQNANDPGVIDPEFWRDCIVVGNPHLPEFSGGRIEAQPFVDLLEAALEGKDGFVAKIFNAEALNPAVEHAARALGRSASGAADRIKALAESAAAVLTQACREGSDVRATSTTDLAERIFLPNSGDHDKALRGLLLARALPESDAWDSSVSITTTAFRVHTFIRNIEGLFASVALDGIIPVFEDFTVERGVTHAKPRIDGGRGRRLFELLYCEACGDLLIGGQRGQKVADGTETELLPSAADLDNMPEKVGAEYYDKMTLDEFAVFWPRRVQWAASDRDYDDWEAASLNPETGLVSIQPAVPFGHVGGYLYRQQEAAVKGRNGKMTGPLMAQPFCCPKCGTDYSNRPVFSRSRSPIRAFRTGVTKTSQLVATELFELLHAIGAEPKGIVFSDSRQDAANQALEIETLHLRDLRREVLVTAARELVKKSKEEWIDPLEFGPLMASLATNPSEMALLVEKINKQLTSGTQKNSDRISLGKLLQCSADSSIGALTSDFVSLGVHPFDRLGKKHFEGKIWHDLFVQNGGRPAYSHKLNDVQKAGLNKEILKGQYELIDDVIFANTFFALEETGLAYPSIMDGNDEKADRLDTWLRVFAGAYRVLDNKFVEGDNVIEWLSGSDIKNKRVHRFAQVVFPGGGAIDGLSGILDELSTLGHPSGIIHIGKLYLKMAKESDPYWRCENCERVHLHRGPGRCTRCGEKLGEQPTGRAEELWRNNFLGSRIVRGQEEGVGRFRLRVEELTGQTDDFSDRLRKFKGIFVDGESEIQKRAQEIDMLSVTTTMEVGIDIGALQSVYQANMPPQRFNYQQRVGRAGRRGQAFSLVITFCRGRSHDAYYFAHPRAITGDPPPPPFLAIGHDPIPLRLVRKNWLRAAFKYLRDQCAKAGDVYPGDLVMPPDVHGEYISTQDYFHDSQALWPDRLHDALIKTLAERDSFIAAASFDPEQRNRLKDKSDVDHLIKEIGGLKTYAPNSEMGLARFLAEWGLLPMYGMPTRVRNLYLGLRPVKVGGTEDYEWSTMDRDLDLAVFEYAPGAVLVKDKQKHRVVGFTGSLSTPQGFKKDNLSIRALSHWYETETWVAVCKSCGSATRTDLIPQTSLKCDDCQAEILPEELKRYVTPAGFRTDFNPKDGEEDVGRMSVRSMATLVSPGARLEHGNVTVMHGAGVTIMQMNDGVANIEGEGEGFLVQEASDLRVTMPSGTKKPPKIDGEPQAYEAGWLRNARSTSWGLARWGNIGNPLPPFGLISCKQTESVQLELGKFDPRLDLSHVARRGKYDRLSTRAAAISATQILVQKAALELDVSADEFEALEPRVRSGKPLLQIADALINGSGLCRRLGETVPGGSRPKILDILHDVLENHDQWPLVDFLNVSADGDHSAQCHTSCYRCVQRYGNRRYHGLLDWRLGLAYLRSMTTPSYACGLEAQDAAYPEIVGWRERAQWLAENIAQMRPGVLTPGNLPHSRMPFLLERKGGRETRYVIVHPLWSLETSALSDLLGNDWSPELRFVDTFNLERRPLKTMANWLKAR